MRDRSYHFTPILGGFEPFSELKKNLKKSGMNGPSYTTYMTTIKLIKRF